ncbi:MAG: hypothetical protein KGL39_12625 [Patescibacteria group bacterium]|nr:hypothetical protein [Patescibacteria group bacterium]
MFRNIFYKISDWFSHKDPYDLYKPGERLIYHYYDGIKTVSADPLRLYRQMMDVGPELSVEIKVSRSASKDASKAHVDAIKHIRSIFDIKPYEEGGLTEVECLQLLDHFWIYTGHLKKNSSPSPTSVEATLATSASTSGGSPPTSNMQACGSTANGPSTAPPAPLPTGSASV